jgi:hypothetical protein
MSRAGSQPNAKKRKAVSNTPARETSTESDEKNESEGKTKLAREDGGRHYRREKKWENDIEDAADVLVAPYFKAVKDACDKGEEFEDYEEWGTAGAKATAIFESFKPLTKFDVVEARKFVQALREWQEMARVLRERSLAYGNADRPFNLADEVEYFHTEEGEEPDLLDKWIDTISKQETGNK